MDIHIMVDGTEGKRFAVYAETDNFIVPAMVVRGFLVLSFCTRC